MNGVGWCIPMSYKLSYKHFSNNYQKKVIVHSKQFNDKNWVEKECLHSAIYVQFHPDLDLVARICSTLGPMWPAGYPASEMVSTALCLHFYP
jgi:hypothetical protein